MDPDQQVARLEKLIVRLGGFPDRDLIHQITECGRLGLRTGGQALAERMCAAIMDVLDDGENGATSALRSSRCSAKMPARRARSAPPPAVGSEREKEEGGVRAAAALFSFQVRSTWCRRVLSFSAHAANARPNAARTRTLRRGWNTSPTFFTTESSA